MSRVPAIAVCLLAVAGAHLAAQDSSFILSTTDPGYRFPGFVGNGAFSLVTTPLGTSPAASFASGVYDHGPDDVPRIALLPAWNEIDLFNGAHWLNATDPSTLQNYRQTLDLSEGTLRTRYDWRDGERRATMDLLVFVSQADPSLAVIKLEVVPQFSGRLRFSLPLRLRPAPHRLALARLTKTEPAWTLDSVWYPGHVQMTDRGAAPATAGSGAEEWLVGRTVGRHTGVTIAAVVGWPTELEGLALRPVVSDSGVALEASIDARAGRAITIYKYVAIRSRLMKSVPLGAALQAARDAAARGYAALLAAHQAAWHRLWESDVIVDGDVALQRVIHTMLFDLLSSVRPGTGESISPMGLSSAGYYGHVFWDADTWMFPPLLVLHPDVARSMAGFRARSLDAARRNAASHRYRGAMYPWESDELGVETTPYFARQNALYENHVTGDVARAQWEYYLATGDSVYLARSGYPVLAATADFWVSRARSDSQGRYHLRPVVSVAEGMIGIGDDAYTNAVAQSNLDLATAAARRLGRAPDPRWTRVARGLVIAYDSAGRYHPTYPGAPSETRGEVVPLLAYPLELAMSEAAKRNDLEAAVRRLASEGSGAMMTVTLYGVVGAELGMQALVDSLLPASYQGYLRPPFNALSETPKNDAVNFITGAGGFLQQLVFGYTGLRFRDGGLTPVFHPVLPSGIRRLELRHVATRTGVVDIIVEGDSLRMVPR